MCNTPFELIQSNNAENLLLLVLKFALVDFFFVIVSVVYNLVKLAKFLT